MPSPRPFRTPPFLLGGIATLALLALLIHLLFFRFDIPWY
jgi:hypothetical protein